MFSVCDAFGKFLGGGSYSGAVNWRWCPAASVNKLVVRNFVMWWTQFEDDYLAKIEFTDPDSGEVLYGNFQL